MIVTEKYWVNRVFDNYKTILTSLKICRANIQCLKNPKLTIYSGFFFPVTVTISIPRQKIQKLEGTCIRFFPTVIRPLNKHLISWGCLQIHLVEFLTLLFYIYTLSLAVTLHSTLLSPFSRSTICCTCVWFDCGMIYPDSRQNNVFSVSRHRWQ